MTLVQIQHSPWQAVIDPAQGGNIVRLTCEGIPVLRTPEEASNHYLFGSPILLPANRTTEGRFTFREKAYQLSVNEPKAPANLHGLVHLQMFQVMGQGDNWVELQYRSTSEVYPFPFQSTVRYILMDHGIKSLYCIENVGQSAMPFTFALHTTFVEPDWFMVPLGMEQERDEHNLATGRYLPLNEQQTTFTKGTDPRQCGISGYFSAAGHEARIGSYCYRVCPAFDHWILFNGGGGSGQLCVEPQLGAVNGLNLPGGCRILAPGEHLELWTEVAQN